LIILTYKFCTMHIADDHGHIHNDEHWRPDVRRIQMPKQ